VNQSSVTDARVDLETRASDDHHQALRLWLRLLACTGIIEAVLRSRLRSEFGTTLPRFDLMAQLERNPAGLRMTELSKRMMVTSGNITGITDQLVDEGLVRREPDPDDRRAFVVRLTPAGRRLFDRMAAVHEGWIVELFGGLGAADMQRMYALLARLKAHLAATEGGATMKEGR
jgi:DNA-binding MarR family transcriptional regulator